MNTGGLPGGTVTFLFTDIQGSTRLWDEHPEAMKAALARHDGILRAAVESHRGHVFKTGGDAFFAVFASPLQALEAAVEAQRALAETPGEIPGGLQVRMAIRTGTAEQRDSDYYGLTLSQIARLLAAGHGGQVLVAQTTHALVADHLPPEVTLRDLGAHRFKDLQRPEQVFQVIHPALPSDFPVLLSMDAMPNNLPVLLTSFVGRDREIAEVKRLLSGARLLTLTGIGGSGKTRLAIQVAADMLDLYPNGVWLALLDAIVDPALVPQTVASVLGVHEQHHPRQPIPLLDTMVEFLRPKSLLLILDNCEHVLAACAQLADALLRNCPGLRVLATSQEALGISGEQTYPVPPLSLPERTRALPPDDLTRYESVRLFVDRAAVARPGFALTAENAPAVAQVVTRVDGIPLAIELAAARVKVMPVEQIHARLEDRFRLLTTGSRTAAPRHRTLEAVMAWSYDLLDAPERALFGRLSVFAGGWTLEAAEVVGSGDGLEEPDVLDLLTRLVDKSFVQVEERRGEGRYRYLETVRQYGRERLAEAGEEDTYRRRHRDWFLLYAERVEPQLQGAEQRAWLDRLEDEHDNMRAALDWSSKEEGNVEGWLRLAAALWRFWEVRGYWSEGREALEHALTRSGGDDTPARVKVLNGAARLNLLQGDFGRAHALAEENLELSRKLGDKRGRASCLNLLGIEACSLERFDRAAELGAESLALSQEVGDRWGVADALLVLGLVARGTNDYARASTLLEQSLERFRELGHKWGVALTLNNLGLLAREQGDFPRAATLLEETLGAFRELGDKWGMAFAQSSLGILAWQQKDYARAEALSKESLALRHELGDKRGIAACLIVLGVAAPAQGHPRRAAVLFGASEALREAIGVPLPPFIREDYDRHVAAVRDALGEATFREAWSEGRAMSLDQIVAYASGAEA